MTFRSNGKWKKTEAAISLSGKIDFKWKTTKSEKRDQYVIINMQIPQEGITIINR